GIPGEWTSSCAAFSRRREESTHDMKKRVLLPAAYAAFVIAALVWMFLHAKQTPLAGVLALILTAPWSVLAVLAITLLSPGIFDSSLIPGTLVVLICACVNGAILFRVGARIDATGHGPESV